MNLPVNECPHCSGEVFYRKDHMSGTSWYFASNVHKVDNSGMYDHMKHVTGKWWYCADCHKRIFEDDNFE